MEAQDSAFPFASVLRSDFLSSGEPLTQLLGERSSRSKFAVGVTRVLTSPVTPKVFDGWASSGQGGTRNLSVDASVDVDCQVVVPLEVLDRIELFSGTWATLSCARTRRRHAAWVVGVENPTKALLRVGCCSSDDLADDFVGDAAQAEATRIRNEETAEGAKLV